ALAAYLIEVRSKMSFADFTEKYIIQPLNLKQSAWFLEDINLKKHAQPYYSLQSALPLYDILTYPDGGFRTSVTDISKYLCALILGYKGDTTLLGPDSYNIMFAPQFSGDHPPQNFNLQTRNKGIFW